MSAGFTHGGKSSTKSSFSEDKEVGAQGVENTAAPPPSAPPAVTFPEGGVQGWCTVIGAFFMQFCTFGYLSSFGVYQGDKRLNADFYIREYLTGYTPRDIGWIGGFQLFLTFSCGIVTGRAFDRGYFYHMMIGGTFIHIFCYFMLSLSHRDAYYQVFLSHGVGGGLAIGITYIPSLTVVSQYFARKRAIAMGIVSSGSALGAIIHPIMLNKLFHGSIGFHNGVRISTAMSATLLIISCAMMRTRLPPKKTGSKLPIVEFLSEPAYFCSVTAGALFMCGLFFPPFYVQLDAISHHIDKKFAFYLVSIFNAASFVGRVILPLFAPKWGTFNLMVLSTLGMAITLICFGLAKDAAGFTLSTVWFGLSSGGAVALTPPVLTSLAKDMSEYGARIGIQFFVAGFVALFSTPILGALLSTKLHWWRPIIFGGVTMFGSSVIFAISRHIHSKRKGTQIL